MKRSEVKPSILMDLCKCMNFYVLLPYKVDTGVCKSSRRNFTCKIVLLNNLQTDLLIFSGHW